MSKTYIGLDNGVTGSLGIISDSGSTFFHTPVKRELSYTKAKQWIHRIDTGALLERLRANVDGPALVIIERPMVNPLRFKATVSALRALEATLICVESLALPYLYADSRNWQKDMLPSGLVKEELKVGSLEVGRRLFPHLTELFKSDADSILMAEWARRKGL